MKISIGSKNAAKIKALEEAIADYDFLKEAEIIPKEVSSGVSDQPKSLEETARGAMNRARIASENCDLSFGLESGLMHVPYSKSGFMDVCVCAIFDGKEYHLGLSSAFELPKAINKLMLEDNLDMSQACFKFGLTADPKFGTKEGAIGILTKGRVSRMAYTKQAIVTALIHLENTHLF